MKTTIYLVRHGQSLGNLRNQFMGHTDTPLTELGLRQAELAAGYMENIHIDAIYSSDLQRAYQTALATANRKNMPVTKTEKMREINGGEWETVEFPLLATRFPEDFVTWSNDFKNCRCTGGESVLEMQQRVVGEIARIAEENPGKAVAIFCHATPLRAFRIHCEGAWTAPYPTNASTTVAEYENGKFKLVEYSIDHYMGNLITALPDDV